MDEEFLEIVQAIIPKSYAKQAAEAMKTREKLIRILFQHKKIPDTGWDNASIEYLLNRLSLMDSNNFLTNSGLGEREARIASELVAKRHYNFGHGIGRSGDLTETQPKAAGSSLLYSLTNVLLEDLFKIMGLQTRIKCFIAPIATGMSLVLSLLTLRKLRPKAKYVLWSRIDQKSCFKSILTAGFIPIVIDTLNIGDKLETNVPAIEESIVKLLSESVVCVMTTTSCFAPRSCDNIEEVAKICKKYDVPHLINNAYGLQSKYIMKRIQKAQRCGRVDIFVQSTDKNLMVPVGGAIIASFDPDLLDEISKQYPGRASSSPVIDVFITLLSLGKKGYLQKVDERETCFNLLSEKLNTFSTNCNEKVLTNLQNPISIAITLNKIPPELCTKLGAMLFVKNISGARVIPHNECKTISTYTFNGWGSHTSNFQSPYLTVAASIGMLQDDIDIFLRKLDKIIRKINNSDSKA